MYSQEKVHLNALHPKLKALNRPVLFDDPSNKGISAIHVC
jgi:hypothetical protein